MSDDAKIELKYFQLVEQLTKKHDLILSSMKASYKKDVHLIEAKDLKDTQLIKETSFAKLDYAEDQKYAELNLRKDIYRKEKDQAISHFRFQKRLLLNEYRCEKYGMSGHQDLLTPEERKEVEKEEALRESVPDDIIESERAKMQASEGEGEDFPELEDQEHTSFH